MSANGVLSSSHRGRLEGAMWENWKNFCSAETIGLIVARCATRPFVTEHTQLARERERELARKNEVRDV